MEAKTVIFFGSSGAGKGTQAELLKSYLKKNDVEREILHIETGTEFRKFMEGSTYTQKIVKDALDEGALLPAFLPIWVWGNAFICEFKGNEHLLLDGLARRSTEAPVLDGALKFYGKEHPDIVVLNVPREIAVSRLKKRGRYDDNDEDINSRIAWYEENTIPAINFFREKSEYRIHDIDGEQETEAIHKAILKALGL